MAADYLQEIRSIQPEGPYLIGGYCFGALVAFEMAQRLLARGDKVALLALFLGRPRRPTLAERARFHQNELRRRGPGGKAAYLWEKAHDNAVTTRTRSWLWRLSYRLSRRHERPSPRLLRNIPEMNLRAARSYVPKAYEGRMIVLMSGAAGRRLHPSRDLAGMTAREVEVVEVPGDRDSMLREPFVGVFAERLEACLSHAVEAP